MLSCMRDNLQVMERNRVPALFQGKVMRARLVVRTLAPVVGAVVLGAGSMSAAAADGLRMRNLGEGLELGAALSAAQVTNDNFFYQPVNETEVEGLIIGPALGIKQSFRRAIASVHAGAQIAEFDAVGDNSNYTDAQIGGRFDYDGGVRTAFGLMLGSQRGHDPFGRDRPAITSELDKWTLNKAEATYRYGAPTATLNLEFEGGISDKDYTSNEATTFILDHSRIYLSQLLLVNYSPKTALILELGEDFVDFAADPDPLNPGAPPTLDRDATELRIRTGVRWKATARTTGDLRVGAVRRDLDDNKVRIVDGFSWKAKISWEPLSRTTVAIETFRSSQETVSDEASVVDNRRYSLSYSQGWGRNFRTVLSAGIGNSKFVGSAQDRKDDLNNYALSAIYSFKGSLSIYADLVRTDRDSNVDQRDFDATAAILGIRVSP